jgi:hypothetical protein
MLLGHKIGLASAYYRPQLDEFLTEYEKAIDLLTINEENRLRRKVEKLEVEKSQIEALGYELEQVKKAITLKSNYSPRNSFSKVSIFSIRSASRLLILIPLFFA